MRTSLQRRGASVALAAAILVPAPRIQGQVAAPAAECSYRTCALRVESGAGGRWLVRGSAGEPVGRLHLLGGNVAALLAGPDSAAFHARRYVRSTRRAGGLALAGGVVLGAVGASTSQFRDRPLSGAAVGGLVAGSSLALSSCAFAVRAERSLARAVWWYNAALAR